MLIVEKAYSAYNRKYEYWLNREVLRPNGELNYRVYVHPVYDHEIGLDRGRFALFSRFQQAYIVDLPGGKNIAATGQKLDWIAENALATWSLDIESNHTDHVLAKYSFDRRGDAVKFRLKFGLNVGLAH